MQCRSAQERKALLRISTRCSASPSHAHGAAWRERCCKPSDRKSASAREKPPPPPPPNDVVPQVPCSDNVIERSLRTARAQAVEVAVPRAPTFQRCGARSCGVRPRGCSAGSRGNSAGTPRQLRSPAIPLAPQQVSGLSATEKRTAEAGMRFVGLTASALARDGGEARRSMHGWHALRGPTPRGLAALFLGAVLFLAAAAWVHLECPSPLDACAVAGDPLGTSRAPGAAILGLNLSVKISLLALIPDDRDAVAQESTGGAQAPSTAPAPMPKGSEHDALHNRSGTAQATLYQAERLPPWVPQKGKYLLATCHYGRSTNRLNCMQRGMVIAALMNRTYILVKPDICHLPGTAEADEMPLLVDERHLEACLASAGEPAVQPPPPAPAHALQAQQSKSSAALVSPASVGTGRRGALGAQPRRRLWSVGGARTDVKQNYIRRWRRRVRSILERQPSLLAPASSSFTANSGRGLAKPLAGAAPTGGFPSHLDPNSVPDSVAGRRVVTLEDILEAYNVTALRADRLLCEQPLCTPRRCAADYKLVFPPPETKQRVRGGFSAQEVIVWGRAINHVNVLALGDLFYTWVKEHPATGFYPLSPMFGSTCGNMFQPVPSIMEETKQFIEKHLRHPYAALHLRRTDFQHYCKGTAQAVKNSCPYFSLRQIAHCIWEDLRGSGATKLFVASDAPNWEIVTLRVLLRAKRIQMVTHRANLSHPLRSALLEKHISAHADRFFYQVQSSFSNHIRSLRRGLGTPESRDQPVCAQRSMDFIPAR